MQHLPHAASLESRLLQSLITIEEEAPARVCLEAIHKQILQSPKRVAWCRWTYLFWSSLRSARIPIRGVVDIGGDALKLLHDSVRHGSRCSSSGCWCAVLDWGGHDCRCQHNRRHGRPCIGRQALCADQKHPNGSMEVPIKGAKSCEPEPNNDLLQEFDLGMRFAEAQWDEPSLAQCRPSNSCKANGSNATVCKALCCSKAGL